jgi:hypothetical protein
VADLSSTATVVVVLEEIAAVVIGDWYGSEHNVCTWHVVFLVSVEALARIIVI